MLCVTCPFSTFCSWRVQLFPAVHKFLRARGNSTVQCSFNRRKYSALYISPPCHGYLFRVRGYLAKLFPCLPVHDRPLVFSLQGGGRISCGCCCLVRTQAEADPDVHAGGGSLSHQWGLPFLGTGPCSGFMIWLRVWLSNKQRVFSRRLGRIKGLLVVVFFIVMVEYVWPRSTTALTLDSFFRFIVVIALVLLVVLEIFCLFFYVPEGGALAGLSGRRALGQDIPNAHYKP